MNTEEAGKYRSFLGEALRADRARKQWTRLEFSQRLDGNLSTQTVATYELGTRHVSLVRLIELSEALDRDPVELLREVHERASGKFIPVDLERIIVSDEPALYSLREWAECRLAALVAGPAHVFVNVAALPPLATLCGIAQPELEVRLREFAPEFKASRADIGRATPDDD
ncbi:helix-turn-helix domain-containing protein [Amycolatopsis sp. SB7-3]|uniref:helix-turn-helix domain-containing protein n=1 Tax=Amycolatopsis sp. SB7-3 TaxID=3373438 RepID=UPI0037423DD5